MAVLLQGVEGALQGPFDGWIQGRRRQASQDTTLPGLKMLLGS